MVIANSSVWITYQRQPNSEVGRHFDTLLANDEVIMVGPVMTEILQGARSESEFTFFAERLKSLAYIEIDQETWLLAGEINFRLKTQGNILAMADLIVASLAVQHDIPLYFTDGDFHRVPSIRIYEAVSNQ